MKIHWFSITIFSTYQEVLRLWSDHFQLELGEFVQTPRGGRGFQNIDIALHEAKLYYNPVQQSDISKDYCHIEFTGSACDCVIPTHFRDLVDELQNLSIPFKITRLDIAWDNVTFTPEEFYQSVRAGLVVTSAKRHTLSMVSSPYEQREDGQSGCDTAYLGSKSSNRFVRVYNKRGGTRIEFVCREERANAVALDIFSNLYRDWDVTARSHLRDYLDFPTWSLWLDFIKYAYQADLVITPARKVALIKIERWIEQQVSVALSVFYDVHGWKIAQNKIDRMLFEASNSRNRERYKSILALSSPYQDLQLLQVPETHLIADEEMYPSPVAG
jgi:hypothetical protein